MKINLEIAGRQFIFGKNSKADTQHLQYGFYQNIGGARNSGGRFDFSTLYNLYNRVVDIKQSIKKIQNAMAREGYEFVNRDNLLKQPDAGQAAIAQSFIDSPLSPFTKWNNIWTRDRHVAGNFFGHIEKNTTGQPLKFRPIDPRTMYVVADKYGNIIKYEQRIMGSESVSFQPEEIVHSVMDTSTINPLLGVSPIESIATEGLTELESQKSNLMFYENHSVPAHLLIVDGELTSEQYKELKAEIDNKFKGAENRFKSGMIPFVKDIKTIAPSQKDMQYLETRWFTTKKVVVAFGVDSFILGYTEGVQRGNADTIYKMFYENTVRPQETEFEEMINKDLFPKLGIDRILFKVKKSSYDNQQEVANITRADVLSGIMTVNEARKERGLEPSENELADELLFNGILLDDLANEMGAVAQEAIKKVEERNRKIMQLLNGE